MHMCKTPAHRVSAYAKGRTNVFSRIQSPEVGGWDQGLQEHSLDRNNTPEGQAFTFSAPTFHLSHPPVCRAEGTIRPPVSSTVSAWVSLWGLQDWQPARSGTLSTPQQSSCSCIGIPGQPEIPRIWASSLWLVGMTVANTLENPGCALPKPASNVLESPSLSSLLGVG